jgi:hypothetical protein
MIGSRVGARDAAIDGTRRRHCVAHVRRPLAERDAHLAIVLAFRLHARIDGLDGIEGEHRLPALSLIG